MELRLFVLSIMAEHKTQGVVHAAFACLADAESGEVEAMQGGVAEAKERWPETHHWYGHSAIARPSELPNDGSLTHEEVFGVVSVCAICTNGNGRSCFHDTALCRLRNGNVILSRRDHHRLKETCRRLKKQGWQLYKSAHVQLPDGMLERLRGEALAN